MNSRKRRLKNTPPQNHASPAPLKQPNTQREKYCNYIILAALIALGAYLGITYFGHQVVPNTDFTAFIRTGKEILSFKLPASFKRLPGLGILFIAVSKLLPVHNAQLAAGWLVNAIFLPLSTALVYLIGKRYIGKWSAFVAVLFAINPWTVYLLTQPLAETSMVFFILLAVYLMLIDSDFCYLSAACAGLIRYEGIVLTGAFFLLHFFTAKNNLRRIKVFIYSAFAAAPVLLWLLLTRLNWVQGKSRHYFTHYGNEKNSLLFFPKNIYEVTLGPLLNTSSPDMMKIISTVGMVIMALAILTAAAWAVYKKRYKELSLVVFAVIYFFIHALRSKAHHRYVYPFYWLMLILTAAGLARQYKLLSVKFKIPRPVKILTAAVIIIISLLWLSSLAPIAAKLAPYSTDSKTVPFAAIITAVVIFAAGAWTRRASFILPGLCAAVLVSAMAFSNQLLLPRLVGNGNQDLEFKLLGDWYAQNATPGEKLATTLPNILRLYYPKYKNNFVHTQNLPGSDPQTLTEGLVGTDIKYIAWDSRLGFAANNSYYKGWRLDRIAFLAKPRSIGPYKFITQIKASEYRYINLFEFDPNQQ